MSRASYLGGLSSTSVVDVAEARPVVGGAMYDTLRCRVACVRYYAPSASGIATRHVTEAELRVRLEGGAPTTMVVTLRWKDRGAECWLGLQANRPRCSSAPTPLRRRACLRLNIGSRPDARGRPTGMMFRACRNAGRNSNIGVNFYDRTATLKKAGRAALPEARREWLLRHLRVDVTPHPPAVGRMFTAAGLGGETPTVSNWCRALAQLDDREDRLRGWLTHEALARRLRLPVIAGFEAGVLRRARDRLSGRPRLMAAWDDWRVGKDGLRQLLRARGLDTAAVGAEVGAEVRTVRKAGLDPDLPPPVLHRLAMISPLWGFSGAEAREYAEALASEDVEAPRRLLRRGRAFLARTRPEFLRAVVEVFHPAPVPTIDVLRPAGAVV